MTNKDSSTEPNLRLGGSPDVAPAISNQVGNLDEILGEVRIQVATTMPQMSEHDYIVYVTDRYKEQAKKQLLAWRDAAITAALGEIRVPEKRNPEPSEESLYYEHRHACKICGHDFGYKGYCPCEEFNQAIDLVTTSIQKVKERYGASE